MKTPYCLFLLLALLSFGSCNKPKHTAEALCRAEALMYTSPDSALQMLEAIPDPELLTGETQADYALLLSLARYRCYVPATSDSLINIAVQYYKDNGTADKKGMTWYTYGGIIDELKGNSDQVILAYKEAESCIPQMTDSTLISLIYSNLAYLNKKAFQYEQAKNYYLKAEQINRSIRNDHLLASNYLNLYSVYTGLGQQDNVEWCTSQLLTLCSSLTDSALLAKIYHNIGTWRKKQSRISDAKTYFQQSLLCTPDFPSYKTLTALANLYIAEGETEKADSLFQEALGSTDLSVRANIHQSLYKDKTRQGLYKEAVAYADSYIAVADSFYQSSLQNKTLEAQLKYDQLSLKHEKALLERNLYFTILVAIIMLALAFRFVKKLKRKQHELAVINAVLQQRIDELKADMLQKQAEYQQTYSLLVKQEMEGMQKKIEQLEKLKKIYTSQGFLDSSEIKAAGTLKTISMELKYNPQTDRPHLVHWLNIHKNGFALQLAQTYPQVTQERHLDVCYLSAVGFDIRHIAHLLNVKERTIERYMTDICKKVEYPEDGKKGFQTMIQELSIHPLVKKESENIAKIIKIR